MKAQKIFSTRFDARYLFLILSILLLCILDAHFTIQIIQWGGIELNPLMSALLEKNIFLTITIKYLLTASSLIIFLVYKNIRIFGCLRVSSLIYGVLCLYFILILTECLTLEKLKNLGFTRIF